MYYICIERERERLSIVLAGHASGNSMGRHPLSNVTHTLSRAATIASMYGRDTGLSVSDVLQSQCTSLLTLLIGTVEDTIMRGMQQSIPQLDRMDRAR
ncbi:hypothetical protein KIPB_013525, partial [Kipferlia bialata]|eukprot:g13525.t1